MGFAAGTMLKPPPRACVGKGLPSPPMNCAMKETSQYGCVETSTFHVNSTEPSPGSMFFLSCGQKP